MKHYAGLDVSLKETAICIVDENGKVARRGSVATEPEAIARFFAAAAEKGLAVVRMVHESGQLAIWLQRELKARGLPVVCIDARRASKALSARLNKSDRGDAEGLAQLARTGWFAAVHVRSAPAERARRARASPTRARQAWPRRRTPTDARTLSSPRFQRKERLR